MKVEPPSDCIRPGLSGCEGSGFVDAHTLTHPEDYMENDKHGISNLAVSQYVTKLTSCRIVARIKR